MSTRKDDDSPNTKRWLGDKSWLVAIDTGASVTTIRPDSTARLPKRDLTWSCVLQTTPGETVPILKEVLVEMTMGQSPIYVRAYIAKITHKFILRLDVL
jgi:hypothetical protein